MTPLFRKFLGLHWILFAAMVIMVAMGIYSVYAAVHFRPEPAFSTRWNDQIRWVLIGSVFFFGASLIIETLFSLDGLGRLGFEAVVARDYPVLFGTLFMFSLLGLVVGILSDLMYVWVDPRIDFESREG